ncbi:succinylglutamate desuccinylase/aspartoacylase family protein [Blastopirellula retiformator]|uniref:Succinylglutamate desuccinylase / Aspartoacylase family protein n=1 Tax=Blastopirellula retiformator TaxID=2527970 RepID=A0A5C5VKY9_9BACT|nr:succinylglutamate desuccinylase/aspartoacylase family protein [Blastopirellula retiformator]TWT39266.1 Succinylglutamate desuccinylase / Aspartoacylase family protein [Blastopirellula retiformator]
MTGNEGESAEPRIKRPIDDWNGVIIEPGQTRDVQVSIGESYSGFDVLIPVQVRRAVEDGPVVFITAALHGDEINGTGAIRSLIMDDTLRLKKGVLVLAPVLNILGFDNHTRYLPDRRDLNRVFPGSPSGSLASRMARRIFDEIVARCDYGIDLHTAAIRRTNFPNVRVDWGNPEARKLAEAFGSELIVTGKGPIGAFRRTACGVGCATIILEAGEVSKVEPSIVNWELRGIRNVLVKLGMISGTHVPASRKFIIDKTKWVRADRGGFLQFHAAPGEVVRQGQLLATNAGLLGNQLNQIVAPFDAIVIGTTTLPAVSPGEPICHLGFLVDDAQMVQNHLEKDEMYGTVSDHLATSMVIDRPHDTGG